MLHINCPFCGLRAQKEFAYGGDATVKRPEINKEVSKEEWDNFVYMRKSPRGKHIELWHHISGCRQWFKVQRDTATCLLYTSPSPRDGLLSRMPSSA
mgnify:CR=1 FL=1